MPTYQCFRQFNSITYSIHFFLVRDFFSEFQTLLDEKLNLENKGIITPTLLQNVLSEDDTSKSVNM